MIAQWPIGSAPVAVVMITLNEAHHLKAALEHLQGWAQEIFIVDSYSKDETVDIAMSFGVNIVQRKFKGFGDQWNFALKELPITAKWVMKLDPDERISDELKLSIRKQLDSERHNAFFVNIRLSFMGRPMPVTQTLLRLWRRGEGVFSDVDVNEHLIVNSEVAHLSGYIDHLDSPDLEHWFYKQNKYTSAEAIAFCRNAPLSCEPRIFGGTLERRLWFKKHFYKIPFRYQLLFIYNWLIKGSWRAGVPGWIWARLRSDLMRFIEYKGIEIRLTGREPGKLQFGPGSPDPRVQQYD